MPKATVSLSDTTKFDLKSLDGAYVVLKRMTYGQMVERRAMMKLSIATTQGSKNIMGEMAMANKQITLYEFRNTIVEHNLEKDDQGTLFDFKQPADLELLDPRVGQEIEQHISEMNEFDSGDEGN